MTKFEAAYLDLLSRASAGHSSVATTKIDFFEKSSLRYYELIKNQKNKFIRIFDGRFEAQTKVFGNFENSISRCLELIKSMFFLNFQHFEKNQRFD